jgi:hypothetical protein
MGFEFVSSVANSCIWFYVSMVCNGVHGEKKSVFAQKDPNLLKAGL